MGVIRGSGQTDAADHFLTRIARAQTEWAQDISKNANGSYSFRDDQRSPFAGYDFQLFDFSRPFEGTKNRPTATVKFVVSAHRIIVTLYDDVQYACDFHRQTGRPKAPDDPYATYIGCKTGTRNCTAYFFTRRGRIDMPARMTCKHTQKQLHLVYGNRGRDPYTGRLIPETSPNPYAPWLFTHTMTIEIRPDEAARARGISVAALYGQLIRDRVASFGLVPDSDYSFVEIDDYEEDCLDYCLWKASGLRKEDIDATPY